MALKSRIPALRRALREAADEGVGRAAEHVADLARQLAPVDTGALRASIHVEPSAQPMRRRIVATAPYAAYVEYGTEHSPAQPYLTPAADAIDIGLEVRAALDQAIRSLT